jgi:hypothetical protein
MSKVISTRIDDNLYERIIRDGRPITEILRQALDKYYSEPSPENNDNVMFTGVNREIFEDRYQQLTRLIDKHLKHLEGKK